MSPLRRLLLAGGLAASLFAGCAISEEPRKTDYNSDTSITIDADCGSDSSADSEKQESRHHQDVREVYIEHFGPIEAEDLTPGIKLPQYEICPAKKGDEVVDYFQAIDPECRYGYLRMDDSRRFVLTCKEDCPLTEEYLDKRFGQIQTTFDMLESAFDHQISDYIKPIEIHLTADNYCAKNYRTNPYFIKLWGRDMICVPEWEITQRNVKQVFRDEELSQEELDQKTRDALERNSREDGNGFPMIGHEAHHAIMDELAIIPERFDEMGARLSETYVRVGSVDMCDPFNNERAFYTDNYPHGGWQYQLAYDLCSELGMAYSDFAPIIKRWNERREDLGVEVGRIPFRFAIEEWNTVLSGKKGQPVDITPYIQEAEIDADLDVPYTEQYGTDLMVYNPRYEEGYGVFATVCNLGPRGTQFPFDAYAFYDTNDSSIGYAPMSSNLMLGSYECTDTSPALFPQGIIDPETRNVTLDFIVDNHRDEDLNPDNNDLLDQTVTCMYNNPYDLSVETVFGSIYTQPDHRGLVQAIVVFGKDPQPFEYKWNVNGVDTKWGTFDPQGWNRVGLPLWYPDETNGLDQGNEVTLELIVDPNRRLPDINYDNNRFVTTFVLPNR